MREISPRSNRDLKFNVDPKEFAMPTRSRTDTIKPPKHLRPATRRWFANVIEAYELEPHHLRRLQLAGEAWDRGEQARLALAEHGITFLDRWGAPHPRPEVAIERDSRLSFTRLIRELDLDVGQPAVPSRPPALVSNRRI
jgi:phage terminase small subunit